MDDDDRIFQQPANKGILDCLRYLGRGWKGPLSCHPSETDDPYYELGTHPDLVEVLWDKLTANIPIDTRWVIHGRPVLVHPETSTIFAFATGTHTYAFRIPFELRQKAKAAHASQQYKYPDGSVLDLTKYDADWVFGRIIDDEEELCLTAFQSAGDVT